MLVVIRMRACHCLHSTVGTQLVCTGRLTPRVGGCVRVLPCDCVTYCVVITTSRLQGRGVSRVRDAAVNQSKIDYRIGE